MLPILCNMNILVLTTVPHYFAIIPAIVYKHRYSLDYGIVILVSSSISVLWHLSGKRDVTITVLDYFLAAIWLLCDLSLSKNDVRVVCLNIIMGASNLMVQNDLEYWKWHSIWHIFSSLKCLYISYYIMSQRIVKQTPVTTLLPLRSVNPDMLKTPFRRMRV